MKDEHSQNYFMMSIKHEYWPYLDAYINYEDEQRLKNGETLELINYTVKKAGAPYPFIDSLRFPLVSNDLAQVLLDYGIAKELFCKSEDNTFRYKRNLDQLQSTYQSL